MSEMRQFYNRYIEESTARLSRHILLDQDFNKGCSKVYDKPVDITPKGLDNNNGFVPYHNPQLLNVYPSKADEEDYLKKAELLNNSIHRISNQVVYEIKGNNEEITCRYYGERDDVEIISSSVRNYYPNSHLELHQPKEYSGNFFVYVLFPRAPFYRSLSTYHDFFVVSPLNMIPQILLKLDKNQVGVYQVIIKPLGGHVHSLVSEAIDTEWTALQGEAGQNKVLPSLQGSTIGERLTYKSPEFRQYYSVCVRLILPTDVLNPMVKSFVSNFNYGQKGFTIYDNQYYSQEQINQMMNKRVSFNTGFLSNAHEITILCHPPYQLLSDKKYTNIFKVVPAGDKPLLTATNEDICIGAWACGDSSKKIFLPIQKEIPHLHIMGLSRSGKSVLLSHIAIEKLKNGESVIIIDAHSDLCTNTLKMVPEELKDDVIVLDFGLDNATPQITIRENCDDLANSASKIADDLSEGFRDISSGKEKFFGPKLAYYLNCLFFLYCIFPELDLVDIRLLVSRSKRAKPLKEKLASRVSHPILKDFLNELQYVSYESMVPVLTRLSHLLLDTKSLRLFTLDENRISMKHIMDGGKLLLVKLSLSTVGKQRANLLAAIIDCLIHNNAHARAKVEYNDRKPLTVIYDECQLFSIDYATKITGIAKFNVSLICSNQMYEQLEPQTKEAMKSCGTRIVFKVNRSDAENIARDFNNIEPDELTSLPKFTAYCKIEDEVVKINTPKIKFPKEDFSEYIMSNSLNLYYKIHEEKKIIPKKEILEFDKL
jgi:hypothetical protein